MPSITQFVKTILEKIDFKPVEILVTIDTKFYPNDFGINVKPLLVKVKGDQKIKILKYNDLKDMFEHVSLLVKETKYRRLSRDPQTIIINPEKKLFEEYEYHDYKIRRLFLMNEMKEYNKIRNEAYEMIKRDKTNEKENDGQSPELQRSEEELPPEMIE